MKFRSRATSNKTYVTNITDLAIFYFNYDNKENPLTCYFEKQPLSGGQFSLGIVGDYLVSCSRQYEAFCKLTDLPANEPSTYWIYLERHKTYSYH